MEAIKGVREINNIKRLSFDNGEILEYQKMMFAAMEREVFLPMTFATENGRENVYYNLEGFTALEENERLRAKETFEMLNELIKALIVANEYLIFSDSFEISGETIYRSFEGKVKLLFKPVKSTENKDIQKVEVRKTTNQNLCDFIEYLGEKNLQQGLKGYLESTENLLKANCSVNQLLRHISKVLREINC